ncbi:hypothetical protein ACFQ0T_00735 [Kitasatospora gansuensis]
MPESSGPGSHAVVAGAGIGGLLAARVLSETYELVTLVDRDTLPQAGVPRRGCRRATTRTGCCRAGSR